MRACLLFLAVLASALLLAGCGSSGGKREAITAVVAYVRGPHNASELAPGGALIPGAGGKDCLITGPGASPGVSLMAQCDWNAHKEGEQWQVTITETYKCSDFNALAGRKDFCQQEEGSHSWTYGLDSKQQVSFLTESGQPAAESFFIGASKP